MLYEVLFHTAAYAKQEWRNAQPWNAPTSAVVAPGATRVSVRLQLAPTIEGVPDALLAAGLPVARRAVGDAAHRPEGRSARAAVAFNLELRNASAGPPGALAIATRPPRAAAGSAARRACRRALEPRHTGRHRHPRVRKRPHADRALSAARAGGGARPPVRRPHLAEGVATPTRRTRGGAAPFMGYDASRDGSALLEEPRVFMGGLSDEAGAAAPLAMAMKQLGQPQGRGGEARGIRPRDGLGGSTRHGKTNERRHFLQGADYSVRASMLYWSEELDGQPERMQATTPALWTACHKCWPKCYWMHCWSEKRSLETWRSYNYPHVAAVYWSLYRLARSTTRRSRRARAGVVPDSGGADGGGNVEVWRQGARHVAMGPDGGLGLCARPPRRRGGGLAAEAAPLREMVSVGWQVAQDAFPYGSSSVGLDRARGDQHVAAVARPPRRRQQDGGRDPRTRVTCRTGRTAARRGRYWDFTINGKTQWGNEREFHHYGSTLNAIRSSTTSRVPAARLLSSARPRRHLTNIDESSAASMAWHGDLASSAATSTRATTASATVTGDRRARTSRASARLVCLLRSRERRNGGGGGGCETAGTAARGAARRLPGRRLHRAARRGLDGRGGADRRLRRLSARQHRPPPRPRRRAVGGSDIRASRARLPPRPPPAPSPLRACSPASSTSATGHRHRRRRARARCRCASPRAASSRSCSRRGDGAVNTS